MSTIIKFELKELRRLANNKDSCVVEKRVTQNLALQPWCLGNLKESLKNLLDYKIGKFDKEFNGILLSYKNLRVLQNIGTIRNDNADIHFQVQADYFIFQPRIGATLKGIVNKKSTTHLGILVHRVFNVVIPRPTEEPGNKWIGAGIQEGQEVVFKIVVLDLYGALPYIRGELDEKWVELANDGDDEIVDNKSEVMNVSYVNFDKTKPHVQKQIGDALPHSSSKKQIKSTNSTANTPNLLKHSKHHLKSSQLSSSNHTQSVNGKSLDVQNEESQISVTRKIESKGKILEHDMKNAETNPSPRQSKKHKRDLKKE